MKKTQRGLCKRCGFEHEHPGKFPTGIEDRCLMNMAEKIRGLEEVIRGAASAANSHWVKY